jgi:hypothetical protein
MQTFRSCNLDGRASLGASEGIGVPLQDSILMPPAPEAKARFSTDFGQRVLLTIDTEEEFDWSAPFTRDQHDTTHVARIVRFQHFCEAIGAHPVYLVDWPIANSPEAVEIIGDASRRGAADIGIQLHPWVNPPFDETISTRNSFPGNLPPETEADKFMALRDRFEEAFGAPPLAYRAGRYGAGPQTAKLLRKAGIAVDTSVRPLFDYRAQGGPDYSNHPIAPYWLDGDKSLLEVPITSVFSGLLRPFGPQLHRAQRFLPTFFSGFSRFSLLERIALTPEGVSIDEARRGFDIALNLGVPVLTLSLHSPSLAPGNTVYARDEEQVEAIYHWLAEAYAYLSARGVRGCTINDIVTAAH